MSLADFEASLEALSRDKPSAPPLQDAIDAAQALEVSWADGAFAAAEAVGLWIDDIDDPHVAVAVHDGRIVYIGISDGMLRGPLDQLQDTLNACIMNAFGSWRSQITNVHTPAA